MNVYEVPIRVLYKIVGFEDDLLATRMAEKGLLPGREVRVVRKAILGGPVYIECHHQRIALRKTEAFCVLVEPINK